MSQTEDTETEHGTVEETESGGSRADQKAVAMNPRFNHNAETDGLNPRLRRGEAAESEESEAEASGYEGVVKEFEADAEEREAVRKEAHEADVEPDSSVDEALDDAPIYDLDRAREEVAKEADDGFWTAEERAAIQRELDPLAKSEEVRLREKLDSIPEEVAAVLLPALAARSDVAKSAAAAESGEADPFESLAANYENLLTELEELEADLDEDADAEDVETAAEEARERIERKGVSVAEDLGPEEVAYLMAALTEDRHGAGVPA